MGKKLDIPPINSDGLNPIWSFKYFNKSINFPEEDRSTFDFHEICDKLKSIEGRTWGEIVSNSKRDHPIRIDQLQKFAKDRFDILGFDKDKIQELFRLELTGKQRLWGYREHQIFFAIWWDPYHQVCPSHLKHT
jgi:hypothetical protein